MNPRFLAERSRENWLSGSFKQTPNYLRLNLNECESRVLNSSCSSPDCRLFEAAQDESRSGSLSPLRQNHEDSTSPPLLLPSSSLLSFTPLVPLSSPHLSFPPVIPHLSSSSSPPLLLSSPSFLSSSPFSPPLLSFLTSPSPPSPPLHLLHSFSPDLLISPPVLLSFSSPALLLS